MANWALDFDGLDNKVVVSDSASLDIGTSDFSIGCWVKITSGADLHQFLVDKRNTGSPYIGYCLYFSDGLWNILNLQVNDSSGLGAVQVDIGFDIRDDTWHYIEVTIDRDSATGAKFYVDGDQKGASQDVSARQGSLANARDFLLGTSTFATSWTDGLKDEVRISSKVRTPAEITAIWNGGNGIQFEVDADTVALWHMNEGSGSTIFDETANNNDGTITGASWVTGYNFLVKQAVGSGAIAIAGSLSTLFRFTQIVGAGAVTMAGALGRLIKVGVGAGAVTIAGVLGRKISLGVGAGVVTIAGSLSSAKRYVQAVGQGAVTMVGTLVSAPKVLIQAVWDFFTWS